MSSWRRRWPFSAFPQQSNPNQGPDEPEKTPAEKSSNSSYHEPPTEKRNQPRDQGSRDEVPPPYESQHAGPSHSHTTSEAPPQHQSRQNATSPDSWPGELHLAILPYPQYPGFHTTSPPPWIAQFVVTTSDLPALMRHGFHWTEANVRKEKGYFMMREEDVPQWARDGHQVTMGRFYALSSDLEAGAQYRRGGKDSSPPWEAQLWVFGTEIGELTRFRTSALEVGNIYWARAQGTSSTSKGIVYHFDAAFPERNINSIYDDMPLGGWWPWPK